MTVWRPRLNANWSCTLFLILKCWWTRPLLWKMRDAVWKISASEKGTRLITLAITEARQIFKRVGHTNPHPMSHAQSRIFMQGTRNSPIAPALLVTLVEKKGTMPNSAPSRGTRPRSQTTVEIIQRPSATISTPKPNNGGNNSVPKRNNFNPNNNHRKGHLNHVTKEEAQNALDIVLGTFPVNTIPAMVLFDSGASHSFISKSFALQNNFSMLPLEKSLTIKSPGIQQVSQNYCQNVVIEFEGLEFHANLIVLENKGLDVILGMDWLTTNKGFIDCFNRIVILTHHQGKTIRVSAKEGKRPRQPRLNKVDVSELNKVPVVCEFPDVFPESCQACHQIEK